MIGFPNDAIVLRFYSAEDDCPPIRVRDLAQVERTVSGLARGVLSAREVPVSDVGLLLVAPPRRACLELAFQPVLVADFELLPKYLGQVAAHLVPDLTEARDWAEFLWVVVFGAGGVLHAYRREKPEPRESIRKPSKELRLLFAGEIVRHPTVVQAITELTDTLAQLPFDKVEIQVFDEPSVCLFDRDYQDPRGVIGRRVKGRLVLPNEGSFEVVQPANVVGVQYQGREFPGFLAKHGKNLVFVIWGLAHSLPTKGKCQLVGKTVSDPGAVEVLADAPDNLLDAKGIYFARRQIVVLD